MLCRQSLDYLFRVAFDDTGDVGLFLLVRLKERIVLIVACGDVLDIAAEIHDLLVLYGCLFGLFGLVEANNFCAAHHWRIGFLHDSRLRRLGRCSALGAPRRRWRTGLDDGLAEGAGDWRTAQVVKPRATARANALGSPCGFRHDSPQKIALRGSPLPRLLRSVKSYQASANLNSESMSQPLTARRSAPISGRVKVPGDKSISHRALILAALAAGRTRIRGLLEAEDVLATARAIGALGAEVTRRGEVFEVLGQGVGGLNAPGAPLDFGNSGTACRLMLGVVAGHGMRTDFTGDASLCRRPMGRVLDPLITMGLRVEGSGDTLPLTVEGTEDILPIVYDLPVPSAQVKSSVLLAGLHAPGRTTVIEPLPTRDHTERMLRAFGAEVTIEDRADGSRAVTVCGDAELMGTDVTVPADPSSAAFVVAAGLICPGSEVVIENVLMNPTRIGFIDTLKTMGADIDVLGMRDEAGEPVGDLRVRASDLKGVHVPPERAPSMIDEYPVLAVLAAFAEGETRMEGLAELKVKESDRLAATAAGLAACGVEVRIDGDDLIVWGSGAVKGGGHVKTHMDHRIAMAFLMLGLGAEEPVTVDDIGMIATSFPGFVQLLSGLGARLS